jgi:hypothetical protein
VRVVRVAEPEVALAAGEVDAAVIGWTLGEEPWLDLVAVAARFTPIGPIEQALEARATDALAAQVPGGSAALLVARVPEVRGPVAPMGMPPVQRRVMWSSLALVVVVLGMLTLPARTVAERIDGTLEALAVTRAGAVPVYVVRVLGATALFSGFVAFPMALMGALVPFGGLLAPTPAIWIELALTVLLANTVLLLVGLVSGSVRGALNWAGMGPMLLLPALTAPLHADLPWVPLVGFLAPGSVAATSFRIAATGALIALAFGAAAWLARGPRALPSGSRDE